MIKRLINWLKKIFKIKDNKPIKVVYTGTTSTELSPEEKARIKRARKKTRNINNTTKGAFGKPHMAYHHSDMHGPKKGRSSNA